MNKKLKLLTLFSTITTTAIEPVSQLTEVQNINTENKKQNTRNNKSKLTEQVGGGYDSISGEDYISNVNDNPFTGYVPNNFDDKSNIAYENGTFTSIQNKNYLVVPYWTAVIKKPHFDSFATYAIDPITKQLSVLNNKVNLGYDVDNKVVLYPQLVGDDFVTFFRAVDKTSPYGIGEWNVGVTNVKTGDYVTYSLKTAIGESTANNRSVYIMTDNSDPLNVVYYLARYNYTGTSGRIIVSKLNSFNPRNQTYNLELTNDMEIVGTNGLYPGTFDVTFGNGYAVPKHGYQKEATADRPLFGWNNLFVKNEAKPIIVNYQAYKNARGYWLFSTNSGLIFVNLGNDDGGKANLQIGLVDSENKATPTANYSFQASDSDFDFYQGTAITFSFFRGNDNTYYLFPSGIDGNTPDMGSLLNGSHYFAFKIEKGVVNNLNAYDYNVANNIFIRSNIFTSSRINYITSSGADIIANDIRLASKTITNKHYRTSFLSVMDNFINFLVENLYFVDLTSFYAISATQEQKFAIEKVALWLGQDKDYSFPAMTINNIKTSVLASFPQETSQAEVDEVTTNFTSAQTTSIQTSLKAAFDKWTITIEGTLEGKFHQWGWYNEKKLDYMFPAYVLDPTNGLTYDNTDLDLNNPKEGLQKLIDKFKTAMQDNTPIKFDSLINGYLNQQAGSDIELTFYEYQSYGKNQLEWYHQKITQEFATFYYGFLDMNSSNNTYWNYFLEDETRNTLTNIDDMVTKWIKILSNSSFNNTTVLKFLINSKIWNNLTVDRIGGKDAVIQQFLFEYTPELQKFKDINVNTFNDASDNLYESFLKTQYFGYDDPSTTNKLDVSPYFSLFTGGLPEIISKNDFISTFSPSTSKGYTYLSKFYNWTPSTDKYTFSRTTQFDDWATNQPKLLLDDIKRIIDEIYSSYWGYGGLSIPSSLLDVFFSFDQKTALDVSEIKDNLVRDYAQSLYQIRAYLNTGKLNDDLNNFLNTQMNAAKQDLMIILDIFNKYYYGYDYDFSGSEPFVGAKNIALFLMSNGNMTNGIADTYEGLFNNFRLKIIGSDLVKNDGKDYTGVSAYLKSLYSNNSGKYEPISELLNYQKWSEQKLAEDIDSIAKIYLNNYYGYAIGDDATTLNLWFGTLGTSYLALEQLKSNFHDHFISLNQIEYKSAMKQFSQLLGTDLQTEDSILGRDFKSAMDEINLINQLWRDNYYGAEGYIGNWFQYTYSSSSYNWVDITNRNDISTIQSSAVAKNKLMKDFLNYFKNDEIALTAFKSYQNTELLKLLQPIIDSYNKNYMGYSISTAYALETIEDVITVGWNYDNVISKITSIISKTKDTQNWEYQYVKNTYDTNSKQIGFFKEQMTSLVNDINDNFIGNFIKNNYFGYNFGADIPNNVKKILNWQNSSELNAIWDTTTWNNDVWANNTASTYKIFNDINLDHENNLKNGKTFKNILDDHMDLANGIGAEFVNYQILSLTNEITTLITAYRNNYMGYTSESVINSTYLPGISPAGNGHLNWNLNDTLTSLTNDGNGFQDANRLINGKWLHNDILGVLATKVNYGTDNLKSVEEAAFEDDINKIISEYKKVFRGFVNNVNGNRLTFKTLGGDNALENGVFIRTSTDVTSEIFNKDALKTYITSLRNVNANPTWQVNVIEEYTKNITAFKDEQTSIFYNYLDSLSTKYATATEGYFATFEGEPLKYLNLPGWKIGKNGAEIDLNFAINFFDSKTYNQMTTPDSSANYRLSYDAWKKFDDNVQNYENEQRDIFSKDIPIIHPGFERWIDIIDMLSDEETDLSWNTIVNYRGNYGDSKSAHDALSPFLNPNNEPTSLADLNNISSNWYSGFEGDEDADWTNTSLKHSFMFFGQYGMPLQVFYDPADPTNLSIAIVNLNNGEYIMQGIPDSIVISPNSQDGSMNYGTTVVITQGNKQITYKMIPSSVDTSPYDQLLFTVADTTWGLPAYELAQKITVTENFDNVDFTENSVSVISYNKDTFSYGAESPNANEFSLLKNELGTTNTIETVGSVHHVIQTYRNAFIQIGVGNDIATRFETRSNISISNANLINKTFSLNEILKRLPAPFAEDSTGMPTWLLAAIISISVLTVLGIPLAIILIRKKKASKNTHVFKK
ncbi:MAG: hypothetical protein ACRAS9_01550 [Mycoplasma sp.]